MYGYMEKPQRPTNITNKENTEEIEKKYQTTYKIDQKCGEFTE